MISNIFLKFSGSQYLILLWAFLGPIKLVIATIILMLITDFFLDLWVEKKTKMKSKGNKIELTLSKIIVYSLTIFFAYLVEVNIIDYIPLLQVVSGYLATLELKQIIENVDKISGTNLIEFLTNKIKEFKSDKKDKN